ncbi:3-hydroxyacyl-CoA dehydrogenase NAD-binding domain-containing protein [Ferrovibrio xuzhouensis]|uniref:3-hydroxyacyl-CoA dehydrogenase NAD-binding domain-containing protein n=1 Tax=Ferrovibrio xuzhouensis TaxID=1576914 RepID=A0ABV7VN55_9PROT
MIPVKTVAVIGCGTVGASWAALFLAHGLDVQATDPSPEAEAYLRRFVVRATAQLAELGLTGTGKLSFSPKLADALQGADFVQENAPEKEALKQQLLADIDDLLPPDVIVAGSTSSLLRSRLVVRCRYPERHITAHPFNPPHLVPLVELVGADADVVERAAAFYRGIGRRPVILRREMAGHLANRLASAVWREAIYMVEQGVASVADIDAAMAYGPGLRWSIMGPHMTYHLGGGDGGIAHYLSHLGASQVRRWAALGTPVFDGDTQRQLVEGVAEEAGDSSVADLEAARDAALIALLKLRPQIR